ncbi:MAG: hypothetical protein SGJ19_20580, partial [Planctomycetia bacterium]|nr:hypothetical protein [Planctomycetia bacterium]
MRVLCRITVILGLFAALPALVPNVSSAQDSGERDRRGGDNDDDDDNGRPPWQRGRNFGPAGGGGPG